MNSKIHLFEIPVFASIFTILFYNQSVGLNLVLFELLIILRISFAGWLDIKEKNVRLLTLMQVITSVFTVLTYSAFLYTVHFFVSSVFIGVVIYPQAKSLLNSVKLSLFNVFNSQLEFFKNATSVEVFRRRPVFWMWQSRLFVFPIIIIMIFVTLYSESNPKFNLITLNFFTGIFDLFESIVTNLNMALILTFVSGIFICNMIFQKRSSVNIVRNDQNSSDFLYNSRESILKNSSKQKIRNEITSAVFLLTVLNVILLVVNIIDIKWVWFGFEWEGQYLKQFVHEGTFLLILSILISIAIVLYFFRGGINYVNNKWLKYLSYAWLIQNFILAISVALRNLYYIQNFNLAYKRIGVIIFLVLTIYGLLSVILKVRNRYSAFYLFRTNFNALILVLAFTALFNWDNIIAKYNFKNSETAFVHYNFLSSLPNKSLPYLDKTLAELQFIDKKQKQKFTDEQYYMDSGSYFDIIQNRKVDFKSKWESKSWMSWNLPEQLAYHKLFNKNQQ